MADILLTEDGGYIEQEDQEPILLESNQVIAINNFEFVAVNADGMSVTEKLR